MLIESDFSTHCYSLQESQQLQLQQLQDTAPYQQLCPSVFYGPLTSSSLLFLNAQDIKVLITYGSVLDSISLYNELQLDYTLMLIIEDTTLGDGRNYTDAEIEKVRQFEVRQCEFLQTANDKFNTDSNKLISSPFLSSSSLLSTLQLINHFMKNFNIHYPDLSILMDFQKGEEISTIILLSYLNHLKPKMNLSTLVLHLQHLNPAIDANILQNPYYNDVLVKLWESNYYSLCKDDLKRSLSTTDDGGNDDKINDNIKSNDDLKRKKI